MAQGYWSRSVSGGGCRCSKSGPKQKYYCPADDHVAKAPWGSRPHCPACREPMLPMGDKWRPGKKGRRSLEHSHQSPGRLDLFDPRMSEGERLLLTLERSSRMPWPKRQRRRS
jgi:hypothetical protein